jgi:hypothetical protein
MREQKRKGLREENKKHQSLMTKMEKKEEGESPGWKML